LVVGVNWLGDALMSMPALQDFRAAHPELAIDLLVKPKLSALWKLHAAPDRLLELAPGPTGPFQTGARLRAYRHRRAVILPNSIRSALPPWWAGIPERRGAAGGARRLLLTQVVDLPSAPADRAHQAYEAYRLFGLPGPDTLPAPVLRIPREAREQAERLLEGVAEPRVALIPGAARGPSKQWPEEHFRALAGRLRQELGAGCLFLGTPDDEALCGRLAAATGGRSLAGRTGLHGFAAALAAARLVVANDSGGMHLAAALGAPTIGLFGLTDPARTRPLGPRVVVLQRAEGVSRDIPRDSPRARAALARISPAEVFDTARALLQA
jgi:heptosyltransferase-2